MSTGQSIEDLMNQRISINLGSSKGIIERDLRGITIPICLRERDIGTLTLILRLFQIERRPALSSSLPEGQASPVTHCIGKNSSWCIFVEVMNGPTVLQDDASANGSSEL